MAKINQKITLATLCVLVLVVLGAISCYFTYQELASQAEIQATNAEAAHYSELQSTLFSDYIQTEQNRYQAFIADKLSKGSINSNDLPKLEKLEELLSGLSTDSINSWIVLTGDNRKAINKNYAALELLAQAEKEGKAQPPEAVKIDKRWVALFVLPILSEEAKYQGAVVAIHSFEEVENLLTKSGFPGKTKLIQQLPGIPPQTILSVGLNADTDIQNSQGTAFPEWTISFLANSQISKNLNISYSKTYLYTAGIALLYLLVIIITKKLFSRGALADSVAADTGADLTNEALAQPASEQEPAPESESYLEIIPPVEDKPDVPEPEVQTPGGTDSQEDEQEPREKDYYPKTVFRAYDIRGIVYQEITPRFAEQLGKAIGSMAISKGENRLITARDGRLSSAALYKALEAGILSTGCDVTNIGAVPTPVMNYATFNNRDTNAGIIVTASHNPSDYNGFKICFDNRTATPEEIQLIYKMMVTHRFLQGKGNATELTLDDDYIRSVSEDVVPGFGLKVVIDTGNGIAGHFASRIIEELGCQVTHIFAEVDGSFPNHTPDTSKVENLQSLVKTVKDQGADLGFAFDGDGDRLVAVTGSGKIVWPDELMMIFARDVLSRQPGVDIVFDVKSTHRLNTLISSYGGRPVMWKTGHSNMRNKILECDSPLGGEYSGHIFFRDRWYGFDDGMYAAARLIEILSTREQSLEEITSTFEESYTTPEITIAIPEDEKFPLVDRIVQQCHFENGNATTLDGLRVDFPKAWGLVRASNTSPALTLRFEADSPDALEEIKSLFREQISSIDPRLTF